MNTRDYVQTLNTSVENKQRCLQAMEKYGENHWWEPGTEQQKLAYFQTMEPILLVAFGTYHEAVEKLLGRGVWTHEFVGEHFKQQVQEAWEKYNK